MKGVQCAFEGRIVRAAQLKTAQASGRQFVTFTVLTEGERAQRLSVTAWRDSDADLVPHLVEGAEIYVEGKVELRMYDGAPGGAVASLSVSASLIQPMGLIGHKRPKTPRAAAKKAKADPQAPIEQPFNDALPF